MVALRLAATLLAALGLAAGAASALAGTTHVAVPNGLHGFLLRADEPRTVSFARTPAFAWNPVHGAATYEFQLSTSSAFRDNGIVWQCPSAKCAGLSSPVAAPALSLPWISGSPHGLYARVRSVTADGSKSDWSRSFGFDVAPAAPPTPLTAPSGILRWTPVPGADGYEIWLVDAKKHVGVYTNVLDERDFYTFHAASAWTGSVRWRVRAFRSVWNTDERVSGVPVSQYGAWSPTYKSTNADMTSGQIKLGQTISDVATSGRTSDPAHRLMPSFSWTGSQTKSGQPAELFRVYVFTDKRCLNPVFVGSPVGSPGYAPRPYGGLALPLSGTDIAKARNAFLPDLGSGRSSQALALTADDQQLKITENQPAAKATTSLPLVGSTGQSTPFLELAADSDLGAPVSLWDTNWPQGGYYWTVVPVEADTGSAGTTLANRAPTASTTLVVTSGGTTFKAGDLVQVGQGTNTEVATVKSVNGTAVTFADPTLLDHPAGDPIVHLGGSVVYQDLELPQDVCAAGRVARFGIDSEPSLTAGDDAFASGLSPSGRLVSAVKTDTFYRGPVIAWTPALGAGAYQVQWSKTASPFVPQVDSKSGAAGTLTGATSFVLPSLTPGAWYYRVRGLDWTLPTGAQGMGWSDPTRIVVGGPIFKVVGSGR